MRFRAAPVLVPWALFLACTRAGAPDPEPVMQPTPTPAHAPVEQAVRPPGPIPPEIAIYPTAHPGQFWAPDAPQELAPQAYGKLPPEWAVYIRKVEFKTYEQQTPLPSVSGELPVYVLGAYPGSHQQVFGELVTARMGNCDFIEEYSLVICPSGGSQGPADGPISTEAQAEARAKVLLGPLWRPDWFTEKIDRLADGTWRVVFTQRVNGLPLYTDKPLQVHMTPAGEPTYVLGRRRPLMAHSVYPVRPPSTAWADLTAGRGFALTVVGGIPKPADRFVVTTVTLAYVVTHANTSREIMQPYYRFENARGESLWVAAIAEQYVTWP